ncbi:MAG: nucleotidyltransferase substrate binding protein [Calditrichaceae bacterium]|jgi:nucleotidyltransferase substrate binding protein (TIGR01987 family)
MNQFDPNTRWRQRYENYKKSLNLLSDHLDYNKSSELERAGIIQFFEMTFELSWKLLKDYLVSQGYIVNSPREAIKQAFQAEVIENGEIWIEALSSRNLLSHTYDEDKAIEISEKIVNQFYPELLNLSNYFEGIKNE